MIVKSTNCGLSTSGSSAGTAGVPGPEGQALASNNPTALSQLPSPSGTLQQAQQSGAGAAIGSLLGDNPTSHSLRDIAQVAQDNGAKLSSIYSGGGGGGAGKDNSKNDNPFANLFGSGGGASGPTTPTVTSFGSPPVSDIWHTGTNLSIFEIVTGQYSKTSKTVIIP